MERKLVLAWLLAFLVGGWVGYIYHQQPLFWFDTEWAGVMFRRGYYRSWSLRFCDGQTWDEHGKLRPVVYDPTATNGFRFGHHWPRYQHLDMRDFPEGPPTVIQ